MVIGDFGRPSRSHRTRRRGGFTLVELLVVITIILIVSAVALPTVLPALSHRQVSEAARLLQAVLAGARDAAIRDNNPSGIRLLPDPNFSGLNAAGVLNQSAALAYNRIIPISPAPEYSEGFAVIYQPPPTGAPLFSATTDPTYPVASTVGGATTGLVYPYDGLAATGNVLVVVEQQYALINGHTVPNPPTSWFWNIRVGDKIQFNNAGPWYTVVGPMVIAPMNPTSPSSLGQNPEWFVNVGLPGTTSPLSWPQGGTTATPEFLFLVNGQDDNANGWVDEGWDGVDNNNNGIVDELAEWEPETWLGSIGQNTFGTQMIYTIQRRPIPTINAREISLPSDVVIDASSWGVTNERSRVPGSAFNPYSGTIDIMINPDGSVLPTTLYSSPSSLGMNAAFYHFWLAERQDVYAPTYTTNANGNLVPALASSGVFALPMPLTAISQANPTAAATPDAYAALVAGNAALPYLKGEMRIVTLFTRTGQTTTNADPTFNVLNVNQPFLEAQQGVSGGQQ